MYVSTSDSETKTLDTDKYPVRETAPVNVGCVYVGVSLLLYLYFINLYFYLFC